MFTSSIPIPDQWPLGLVILLFLLTITTVTYTQSWHKTLCSKLHINHRRASTSATPPRSLSPSKKSSEKPTTSINQTPDYPKAFPPSRRSTLPQVAEKLPPRFGAILTSNNPSDEHIAENLLPIDQAYTLGFETPKYTSTGFSTQEIKAMGDFPDYEALSGVPLPKPYEGFDHTKALPRPYRPFRWQYHQTMSLTKLEPDWWLEVENTYTTRLAQRQSLYREYGKQVLDYLPGSELACKELMEMALLFYTTRYPTLFTLSPDKRTFHNHILHTSTNLKTTHPLHTLLNNIPEDFAIVMRNHVDGNYYFRAGVICSSLGWNVSTKISLPLSLIHGPIPDYKEKMSFSMDRYFSKLCTSAPIQRGSWGLEISAPLFMPAGHPHEKLRLTQNPDLQIGECNLRVDWQTLRRLPLSAGVVFNFKALFTGVHEFRRERYVPGLLGKILREGKKSLMEYKGTWHVEHVVGPKLEEWEREQIERREVERDWEVATLEESPFFPGWEEKWHRQQGF